MGRKNELCKFMHFIRHPKSLTFEPKSFHSRTSHVDQSSIVLGSNQIRCIELIDSNVDLFMYSIKELGS